MGVRPPRDEGRLHDGIDRIFAGRENRVPRRRAVGLADHQSSRLVCGPADCRDREQRAGGREELSAVGLHRRTHFTGLVEKTTANLPVRSP